VTLRSHGHRSTHIAALALATALASACGKDTKVTSRVVTTWVPTACAVDGKGLANYLALGDYDGNPQPPVHPLSAVGVNLPEIDTQARELVITATETGATSTWEGLAAVPASGGVNVLVLPHASPCPLSGQIVAGPGSTLAPIGSNGVMIFGGNAHPVPPTFVADLTTGAVTEAQPDVEPPRLSATVTPFGSGALVAGGESDNGIVQNDSWVYSPSLGGFDKAHIITLSEYRAHHAAVVLADGRTALVGGSADAGGRTLLKTLDVIDPTTSAATEHGFDTLMTPRLDPVVVRLANGDFLVVGGTHTTGARVTSLEWFRSDASLNEGELDLPWGDATFTITALEGGGALVVENRARSTWIIGALGAIQQTGATLGPLTNPVLFGGAGGAPILWTGDRFLRWQPWAMTWGPFVTLGGPTPNIQGGVVSPDPGLGIWFDPNAKQLLAMRFDKHNAYSELFPGGSVGLADLATVTSPDELPTRSVVSFDPDQGLSVTSVGQAFVTDRTYADVTVHVTSASMPGACVVLRGTAGEPVILPDDGSTPGLTLDVQRIGENVSFSNNGGPFKASNSVIVVGTRVTVGVRGTSDTSPAIVTGLRITRPGAP
jgi:hypothetical protein